MIYGFKNSELLNITQSMREVLVQLEYLVGLSLAVNQQKSVTFERIQFTSTKYYYTENL